MSRNDMMIRLARLQKNIKAPIDIITIAALMDDSQLAKHVAYYAIAVATGK